MQFATARKWRHLTWRGGGCGVVRGRRRGQVLRRRRLQVAGLVVRQRRVGGHPLLVVRRLLLLLRRRKDLGGEGAVRAAQRRADARGMRHRAEHEGQLVELVLLLRRARGAPCERAHVKAGAAQGSLAGPEPAERIANRRGGAGLDGHRRVGG